MALATGQKAPDFTLKTKTENGLEEVTLSSGFGKTNTVLLFFPFAFTGVCTEELCMVRDSLASYQQLNAQVYGISVDSPFTLEIFAKKEGIPFPLLSDFNKDVSAAYDVIYGDFIGFKGVSKRSAFVINKEGTILYASSSDDPKQLPDFAAIQASLA
jgi:glutaredoxin-dependent peroxiredoxin